MLKILELREYLAVFAGGTNSEFIDFIEAAQAKMKNAGVVSLEKRLEYRHQKELEKRKQESNPFDPEAELNNL